MAERAQSPGFFRVSAVHLELGRSNIASEPASQEAQPSSIGGRKRCFRRIRHFPESRGKNLPYKAVRRIRPPRIRGRFCRRPLEGPLETGTTCPPRVVGASDSPNCLIRKVFTTGSQNGRILLKRVFLPPIEEARTSSLGVPSVGRDERGRSAPISGSRGA